ncbi:pyridoxal 5'-phosphate synthase subunit PdxT [Thermopolyspora flexuosa]|uniref:Pyridoxal 5'-phosphate synthase subunit PdxT n=1 Tax=Thermopolyspora flexuosa TaxID=103836 RepID=A0A543IXB4_9ACTN|nr:pyridoxal 5'-phosphate synthase glutaminase subunit PdxT [Thermopolyspora flexuosa]TQM75209.1 5'-phosphate synthase pdxT subunit [Thermopolyspora flexuosa]GGM91459.1 pyridoxal 5'-phosphate synthase subunit PdxT [Thermopolyspora flexuosa]
MATAPAIGVLALQGDVREHVRALEAAGARATTVRRPAELAAVDALVIPGGESTTMWKLAEAFELLEPLRLRVKEGMPAYGSCAGMIMLADRIEGGIEGQRTIGGIDMTVRRNAFGRQVDSFEADIDFAGRGPLRAVFIRAPWVESVGEDVEVLARVPFGGRAQADSGPFDDGRIVAVRQGPLLATAFHPELTGDGRVHSYFVEMVREL